MAHHKEHVEVLLWSLYYAKLLLCCSYNEDGRNQRGPWKCNWEQSFLPLIPYQESPRHEPLPRYLDYRNAFFQLQNRSDLQGKRRLQHQEWLLLPLKTSICMTNINAALACTAM
ncbi:unnamed protein product [Prunus armeniaca]|uniref:Secreted protein n=1 Tax=Prunus armeniaca TaxID=36596 RepID=A0A6J5WHT9_PRUAR|nr:unnamed protein product [Prunus armeniaca]CAB4299645.1 unnamed protein product [Prunus armeniaca]